MPRAKKSEAKPAMLKVKLVKGLAGVKKNQIAIAESLGLRRIGAVTTQPDSPATQGKIRKITHLVEVTTA